MAMTVTESDDCMSISTIMTVILILIVTVILIVSVILRQMRIL